MANLAPYATAVSYRSARADRWLGAVARKVFASLASLPDSVFSTPESCLLPGKYRGLMCHQQIITRCRHRSRPDVQRVARSFLLSSVQRSAGKFFISPGNFSCIKTTTTTTTGTMRRGSLLNVDGRKCAISIFHACASLPLGYSSGGKGRWFLPQTR